MMLKHLDSVAIGGLVMAVALGGCLPDYSMKLQSRSRGYESSYGTDTVERSSSASTGVPPELGPTVRAAVPPPPLSGGTMAIAPDDHTIVAADPDRDQIYIVDVDSRSLVRTIALRPGDEPGRVVVDRSGRAHVALRSGGDVVTIDLASASIVRRRHVCAAPRGIAHDTVLDRIYVACMSGELASFAASGDGILSVRKIRRDLRDVVAHKGRVVLSTFRDASIIDIADDVADPVVRRRSEFGRPAEHRVAWRMVKAPAPTESAPDDEDVVLAEQKAPDSADPVEVPAQYYHPDPEDDCPSTGPSGVIDDATALITTPGLTLPVDIAVDARGAIVVAAGNGHTPSLGKLFGMKRRLPGCRWSESYYVEHAQLTSVVLAREGNLVLALSREPAALVLLDRATQRETSRLALSDVSREDTGHAIFHSNAGLGVACASCHPEGGDDGHAWTSRELGPRRTPSLLGTLAGTAPYHWNGEAQDMAALAALTWKTRMKGPELEKPRTDALEGWLTALHAPPALPPVNAASAARGKTLFEGVGRCSTCHTGAMRTNNQTVNPFSSNGKFQVPSLVGVAWRAPYTHDGSAPTIVDLLSRGHGGGALENWGQYADLASYLETF